MDEQPTLSWSAIASVALAIGVFGVIYGATASLVIGKGPAIAASVFIYSGAAQFTMVGLIDAGATTAAVLSAVAVLGLRHLPLGAVLRPRMTVGRGKRAALSWFLVDETAGLALAAGRQAEQTLLRAGAIAYVCWILGTILGTAGADLSGVEPLATAIFPVLFVGLAALTARGRSDAVRAAIAGGLSLVLMLLWPGAGALGCMTVATLVCMIGERP